MGDCGFTEDTYKHQVGWGGQAPGPTSAPYHPLSLRYRGRSNMLSKKIRNSSPGVLGCCCVVAGAFVVEERVEGDFRI